MPLMLAMTARLSNAGWLLFATKVHQYQGERELLACISGRTRRLVCISGGADSNEALRQSVRERLADGRLFVAHGVSTLRRGTGRPCNVCGKAITETQEHEVEGRGGTYALTHPDCYHLWREESRRIQPPSPPSRPTQ